MSSTLIASVEKKYVWAEVRLILERMLSEPKTVEEKAVVDAKLADVAMVLKAARAGADVVVPAGWDDDQQTIWGLLVKVHGLEL